MHEVNLFNIKYCLISLSGTRFYFLRFSNEISRNVNKNIAAKVYRGSWVARSTAPIFLFRFSRWFLNREGIWGEWDWHEAYIHPEICLNITVYMDIDFLNTYRIIIEESTFDYISLLWGTQELLLACCRQYHCWFLSWVAWDSLWFLSWVAWDSLWFLSWVARDILQGLILSS